MHNKTRNEGSELMKGRVNSKIQTQIMHKIAQIQNDKMKKDKKKVMIRFDSESLLPVIKPRDFTTGFTNHTDRSIADQI